MAYLKENNFQVITISNLVTAIRFGGNLPQKPLMIEVIWLFWRNLSNCQSFEC